MPDDTIRVGRHCPSERPRVSPFEVINLVSVSSVVGGPEMADSDQSVLSSVILAREKWAEVDCKWNHLRNSAGHIIAGQMSIFRPTNKRTILPNIDNRIRPPSLPLAHSLCSILSFRFSSVSAFAGGSSYCGGGWGAEAALPVVAVAPGHDPKIVGDPTGDASCGSQPVLGLSGRVGPILLNSVYPEAHGVEEHTLTSRPADVETTIHMGDLQVAVLWGLPPCR